MMEFFFDTTRTVTDIMLKGYLTKYPDLKFILPHAGAMLPYIVDRLVSFKPVLIDTGTMTPDFDVIEEYKKFYFDCAGNSAPHQVPDVLEIVDKTHLMYATDYPFTPEPVIMQQNEDLFNAPYMTQELRELIFYKNAMKLFPKAKI